MNMFSFNITGFDDAKQALGVLEPLKLYNIDQYSRRDIECTVGAEGLEHFLNATKSIQGDDVRAVFRAK